MWPTCGNYLIADPYVIGVDHKDSHLCIDVLDGVPLTSVYHSPPFVCSLFSSVGRCALPVRFCVANKQEM